jgi:hypothetical protein
LFGFTFTSGSIRGFALFLLIKLVFFVQATLYRMGERVIEENGGVRDVSYVLPNKHYVPVDMRYIGIDNLTPCVVHSLFRFLPFFLGTGCHVYRVTEWGGGGYRKFFSRRSHTLLFVRNLDRVGEIFRYV